MKIIDRCRLRVGVLAAVTAGGLLLPAMVSPAAADGVSVKWKTIIGIIQAANMVGNIPGGGQPWSTLGGHASVDLSSGRVEFEVNGLVLAGGNSIGTPDNINQVMGTLLCDPGGANLAFNTVLVPLSARGDAEFSGSVGPLPTTCTPTNVAFLVRIAAGRWIANGAVRLSPGD